MNTVDIDEAFARYAAEDPELAEDMAAIDVLRAAKAGETIAEISRDYVTDVPEMRFIRRETGNGWSSEGSYSLWDTKKCSTDYRDAIEMANERLAKRGQYVARWVRISGGYQGIVASR